MKQTYLIVALVLISAALPALGQENETIIKRFEVDFKEIKTDYKVNFLKRDGTTVEAARTGNGFSVPEDLQNDEKLSVVFSFENYVLNFSDVEKFWFDGEWVIGVDLKPFSHKLVNRRDAKKFATVYYAEFRKNGLQSEKVVMKTSSGTVTSIVPAKNREKPQ